MLKFVLGNILETVLQLQSYYKLKLNRLLWTISFQRNEFNSFLGTIR